MSLRYATSIEHLPLTQEQRKAVAENRAWVLEDESGYMVVKITESDGEKSLYIWHAKGVGWNGIMDTLDEIARQIGAKSIKFGTARKGWERHARKYGFEMEKVIYMREVR